MQGHFRLNSILVKTICVITTQGQNFGASGGADIVWGSDFMQDELGTNFIVTGVNMHPDESLYSEMQTTTPAPVRSEFKKCLSLAPVFLLTVWSFWDTGEL